MARGAEDPRPRGDTGGRGGHGDQVGPSDSDMQSDTSTGNAKGKGKIANLAAEVKSKTMDIRRNRMKDAVDKNKEMRLGPDSYDTSAFRQIHEEAAKTWEKADEETLERERKMYPSLKEMIPKPVKTWQDIDPRAPDARIRAFLALPENQHLVYKGGDEHMQLTREDLEWHDSDTPVSSDNEDQTSDDLRGKDPMDVDTPPLKNKKTGE
ncbi:Hypothetical protein D9617_7g031450 [Elsinoe fawcettii]|nr:Hypothetical protein D9617_7g031450 [Elsinoe fawcettii]